MRPYPPNRAHAFHKHDAMSTAKVHECPAYLRDLFDPAIHFLNLGPGLCTVDNLFGLGYLLLVVLNYFIAFAAVCACLRALGRLRWTGVVSRGLRWRGELVGEEESGDGEDGEGRRGKVSRRQVLGGSG